jgi:DNA-binding protein HU-beta
MVIFSGSLKIWDVGDVLGLSKNGNENVSFDTEGGSMKKTDLILAMANETQITKSLAGECLDRLMRLFADELCATGTASLPGLGKLCVVQRAARNGRNPRTGNPVRIEAHKTVRFRPGKGLKHSLQ